VRISIWPAAAQPFDAVARIAQHAARTGWDGVWFADHFMPNEPSQFPPETPVLEAGSVVAALAATVPRVRIGSLVYGNTYRHPAVLANMAATVDRICGGRFVLGVGAGWQENEHRQYGIELPPVGARIDRLAEAVQVLHSLLTQPRTTFEGRYYRLADALCEPKPVAGRLPLLVGASGEQRMLALVARYADEWNCWGLPATIRHKSAVLARHCEAIGRDPAEITRTAQAVVMVTPDAASAARRLAETRMPALAGTPEQLLEIVVGYADLGLDELIVPTASLAPSQGTSPDGTTEVLATMDLLMDQVFAHLRGASGTDGSCG
jgi:F420-dependent oxidoreductase-like protein